MLDQAHLEAIAAVIRTGSFERAAQHLHVTPSAISQRIKALEERLGTLLIVRGQPATPTVAGARLFRHAEEVGLLEQALRADLALPSEEGAMPTIRLAVNADSLATWFVAAMAAAPDTLFDLVLDDQDHSMEWLRRGEVRASVSGFAGSVQGCDRRALGSLRYIATASPAFVARWCPDGVDADALAAAPCITFNAKDSLQAAWARQEFGRDIYPPTHWLPSSQAFVDAALAGLGWGMNPEILAADAIAEGRLAPLGVPFDVPLYWHWSRAVAPALRTVTDAVLRAAADHLRPAAG